VIRQPQLGGAEVMADAVKIPVINGGDGAGQHPTQALLDLYTIQKERGTLEELKVAMVGDLKNGRTVHALSELLKLYPVNLVFVAPPALKMPEEITGDLKHKGVQVTETERLEDALLCDLIYMTRIQKERFSDPAEYDKIKGVYVLNEEFLKGAKKEPVIMHPLPRVDEIATDLDSHAGAAYFRQVQNGVYVRMALLAMVTGAV
jgi:aspartate carbamoyltransferase